MNYTDTDKVLHALSQYVARATRAYIDAEPDDSHTNMAYDALGDRIIGRWITKGEHAFLPGIRLQDQALVWYDDQHADLLVIPTVARKWTEVMADFERLLPELGLDPAPFVQPLHFEIPAYDFLNETVPLIPEDSMVAWRTYRSHANMTCQLLMTHLEAEGEVRIWPHHFDTGIYVEVNARLGLGFGLAMADTESDQPYYYVAGYPKEGTLDYSEAPEMDYGDWRSQEFKGGLLAGEQAPEPLALDRFIRQSVSWLVQQG